MIRTASLLAMLSAGLAMATAGDNSKTTRTTGAKGTEGALPVDSGFLHKALVGGHKEITLSNLADRQSRNEKIKAFAEKMIQDHSKANQQILALLKKQKSAVVAGTEADLRTTADKLGKLEGATFDKEYAQVMVLDHKETVALFENQVKNGKDTEATAFARETLPIIRHHLEMAEKLTSSAGTK